MIGQTLSHFRIIAKLGEGGMGAVYRAEDTKLGRDVAIKVLPEEFTAHAERLARFEREARVLASINHPNIVTIHSVEHAGGTHFLVMELVEGQALNELIPPLGMALERFFSLAIPLADALAAAHGRGITHRDLKPANVMVGADGRVKLLDLGLAKLLEPARGPEAKTALLTEPITEEGKIVGTVAYMSPEQAEGRAVDARSDIFSLGIMLYEMTTGQRPFRGETNLSLLTSILRDSPRPVGEIKVELPRHLGRIIQHCLEKDPERRYQAAKDVRNELEGLKREVDSGQVSSSAVPVAAPGPSLARKISRKWVGPAVAIALLAALAGYWLVGQRSGEEEAPAVSQPVVTPAEPGRQMVVVFPFENLGAAEDEYFATGMSEELMSRLTRVAGLGVISRSTANSYDRSGKTMQQIGEDLGVDYVVEGTVRWAKAGESSRVRITPQLISVADDTAVWGDTYDRVIEDIFDMQSEIASEIIDELGVTLADSELQAVGGRPTDNLEAYQLFLQSRSAGGGGDTDPIAILERVVALDPDFVQAWARLSQAHSFQYHIGNDRSAERARLGQEAAERSLRLDPESPEAHMALGYYHYWVHKEYAAAKREFARALERAPNNVEVILAQAFVARRQGDWKGAVAGLEKAAELDPGSDDPPGLLVEFALYMRDYDEVFRMYEETRWPPGDNWVLRLNVAWAYALVGRLDEARDMAAGITSDQTWVRYVRAEIELLAGEYDAGLEILSGRHTEMYNWEILRYPLGLVEATLLDAEGERTAARLRWEGVAAQLDGLLAASPDDPGLLAPLGVTRVALGQAEEGLDLATRATDLYPISRDTVTGLDIEFMLAWAAALAGEHEVSLESLDRVLSVPAVYSLAALELDPRFAKTREQPGWKELVAKYG